jgi:2-methylcitrate dehydratase PrpD
VSSGLGGFIHDLTYADLPDEVVDQARRCLLDLVGVAAAGSTTQMSRIARAHAAHQLRGDSRTARLLFDGRSVSPVGAALANAATIDAMDAHEGHRLAKGHAGAAVLPAALALLDGDVSSTGRDLLTALVVGYEVAIRAGVVLHATAADYHSSGAWNAIGAAAIGARVLDLDSHATEHALGIAEYHAPRAPMMRAIAHPTMVKDSSAWGAHAGTSAALLAADGFTGAPAAVLNADAEPWSDLGRRWTILEQYFKPYPVCRWAHPAVHGVLTLVIDADLMPEAIERINVTTFDPATRLLTRLPATTEEAQYSLPFAVAAAAVYRALPLDVVAHPERAGEDVRRLASRMRVTESTEMTTAFPRARLADIAVVRTDGRRLSSGPVTAPGDAERPLSDDDLAAKFLASTAAVIDAGRARHLLRTLRAVDDHELADLDGIYGSEPVGMAIT